KKITTRLATSINKTLNKIDTNADDRLSLVKDLKQVIDNIFSKLFKYNDDTNELRINKDVRYFMSRIDTINFTTEQKKAVQTLYNFLIDHKQKTFGLYGYAGSGKTTTVVEFVSYMMTNKYLNSVAFTAPTNK